MNRLQTVVSAVAFTTLAVSTAFGQSVISAHSGLIHYVEGRVLLDSQPVEVKIATFPEMKENMELRSEDGRAEVLLNPGAFLRLGENSAVRMVSNKLSDSRMELLSGSIVVEADSSAESQGEEIVTILYKGAATHIRKGGIYRFDTEPAQLRVYSGEAEVVAGGNTLVLKSAKMVALDSPLAVEKFDTKDTDALSRWSHRRAEYISMANVSAAKYVNDTGDNRKRGDWFYNSYFGMITFLPLRGVSHSPYGYDYYSPAAVYSSIYRPTVNYAPSYGGGGLGASPSYSSPSTTATGTYSGSVSAPAPSVSASGGGGGRATPSAGAAPVAPPRR
jgi:hypothetical protein